MKLSKTEQKILEILKTRECLEVHYLEKMKFRAANSLVRKGVLEIKSSDKDKWGLNSRVFKIKKINESGTLWEAFTGENPHK